MKHRLEGRAWVFGPHVTTDDILPGRYLDRSNDEVGAFAMTGVDAEFPKKVRPGDFIVAGPNFGAGSGRESAPYALIHAGVAAIVAPSFGRIFFRNCVNLGLPPVIVPDVSGIKEGHALVIDLEARRIHDRATGAEYAIENMSGISLAVIQAGGIVPFTRERVAEKRREK